MLFGAAAGGIVDQQHLRHSLRGRAVWAQQQASRNLLLEQLQAAGLAGSPGTQDEIHRAQRQADRHPAELLDPHHGLLGSLCAAWQFAHAQPGRQCPDRDGRRWVGGVVVLLGAVRDRCWWGHGDQLDRCPRCGDLRRQQHPAADHRVRTAQLRPEVAHLLRGAQWKVDPGRHPGGELAVGQFPASAEDRGDAGLRPLGGQGAQQVFHCVHSGVRRRMPLGIAGHHYQQWTVLGCAVPAQAADPAAAQLVSQQVQQMLDFGQVLFGEPTADPGMLGQCGQRPVAVEQIHIRAVLCCQGLGRH